MPYGFFEAQLYHKSYHIDLKTPPVRLPVAIALLSLSRAQRAIAILIFECPAMVCTAMHPCPMTQQAHTA